MGNTATKYSNDRLCCTQLDDADCYQKAQLKTIEKYHKNDVNAVEPYGVKLIMKLNPKNKDDYLHNFVCFAKYGLDTFSNNYLKESIKNYNKILNDLFNKNNKIYTSIINIISSYLIQQFTVYDLLTATNQFKESAMTMAAKYCHTSMVQLLINYSKQYNILETVINHRSNIGTPIFMLFRSHNINLFNNLYKQGLIQPTMMLLLKNGVKLDARHRYKGKTFNVMQMAAQRDKHIEVSILNAFFMVQKNMATSPMQMALKRNDKVLVKILQKYKVDKMDKFAFGVDANKLKTLPVTQKQDNVSLKDLIASLQNENVALKKKISDLQNDKKEMDLLLMDKDKVIEKMKLKSLDTKIFNQWSPNDVYAWMITIDNGILKQYEDILIEKVVKGGIKGGDLVNMQMNDIQKLGISVFKHRQVLEKHIKLLQKGNNAVDRQYSQIEGTFEYPTPFL